MLDVRLSSRDTAPTADAVVDGDDPAEIRLAAGRLARELSGDKPVLAPAGLRGDRLAAFVEGLVLGSYRFSLATSPDARPSRVDLVGVDDEAAYERGLRAAAAGVWARDLANTPANVKTPAWLGAQAERELAPLGVTVRVHGPDWLAEQGFGGVRSVGQGSTNPPCFVEATWRPRGARADLHPVLVGKGITFDTGGINLKPGASMRSMHTDMSGAAAVLAALRAVAQARLPIRVTALVPAAENSFSGSALRPSDVVRHYGGRTSEIHNTDAEGRLVLADALAWAVARLRPTTLVDVATLTGAMKVALGMRTGGLFATTDELAEGLLTAGQTTGEPLWRMPLADDYESTLHSDVADATNAPGNPGGITAALYLQHFTGGLPWAHLDIAGPARSPEADGLLPEGATGFGARLLARWLEDLAEAAAS